MAIQYLLDTNICIYIAKQKPLSVLKKFEALEADCMGMSVITYGELFFGVQKSIYAKKSLILLEEIRTIIPPVELPAAAGQCYGEIRQFLEKTGKSIGNNDLWIAAHALSASLILITNNEKEFVCIPKLSVENWV